MKFTDRKIKAYTESFTTPEPGIVRRLVEVSREKLKYTDMISGRQVAGLLRLLVHATEARRILEIGTFTGYSALIMADVMPDDGELITLEMNQKYREISAPFFSEPPFSDKIFQIMGNAIEIIPRLAGKFDLVYLDADKINYPNYYPLIKERIRKGGLLVVDNVLWGGEVPDRNGEKAAAIHTLNERIRKDETVEQVMLPVRDGILIARFL